MSELEYTEQGWRMTTDTNRHHRTKVWDYKGRGIYHITLVVAERYPLFGELVGNSPDEAHVELNPFGKAVNRLIHDLPTFYRKRGISLKVLALQTMPDHIHFALQVVETMNMSVGEIVRSLKSACTARYKNSYVMPGGNNAAKINNPTGSGSAENLPQAVADIACTFTGGNNAAKINNPTGSSSAENPPQAVADIARTFTGGNNAAKINNPTGSSSAENPPQAVVDIACTFTGGNDAAKINNPTGSSSAENPPQAVADFARIFMSRGSIWQFIPAGYHDKILKGKDQLDAMIKYIKDNPRRLWIKRAHPDLFRLHQQTPVGGILCTTLGNMFLAEHPLRESLHCSRTLTQAEIDDLKQSCLAHAANGTVYISPAISEGEKQICRALREAGYPLIIILSEGFPQPDSPHYKYYKPSGVYFEGCAAGQLLLIAPDAALFDRPDIEQQVYAKTGPIPHNTKRYRFVAQNAIADLIATL